MMIVRGSGPLGENYGLCSLRSAHTSFEHPKWKSWRAPLHTRILSYNAYLITLITPYTVMRNELGIWLCRINSWSLAVLMLN